MKRVFLNIIYSFFAISGIFQLFLLPGIFWNILFPFIQIALLILFFKVINKRKYIKVCTVIIGLVFITDLALIIISNSNTNCRECNHELKIMSYNLFFKNKYPLGSISVIRKENPDILMVQELTPKWNAIINKEIGTIYNYKIVFPLKGTHGIGIYSKYPISKPILLNNSSNKPYAQIVDLRINGKKAQLINTHLASPAIAVENKERFFPLFMQNYKIRKVQIIELNKIAQKISSDYKWQLLVGDLNTIQSEPILKRLKLKWVNSINYPTRWAKFNFPNSGKTKPFLTLDYIFGRGKMKFISSEVISGGNSDHLAITAKIRI